VGYILGIFRNPVVRQLTVEWMPPTIRQRDGLLLYGCVLALIAALVASRRRPTTSESVRLLLFGALAFMSRRNIPWFGFVAAPTIAACLAARAPQPGPSATRRSGRPLLNLGLAVSVGLLAVLSLPWLRPALPLPPARRALVSGETPVQAAAYLCSLPRPVHAFHTEGYGSYLIWACPEVQVFIDTRIELYPVAQWKDLLAASGARYDWQGILDRYDVDTLLLERQWQGPLIEAASASPIWARLYEDEQAVIFQRRGAP